MKVIPFGYSAPNATQMLDALMAQDSRAILVDIRYSTASRNKPAWSHDALQAKYGNRYLWIKDLGNVNYFQHGMPIKIANAERGIPRLVTGLERGYTPILLCTCANYNICHRRVVVDLLREKVPDVEVVQPDSIASEHSIMCLSIRPPYADWIVHPEKFDEIGIEPKNCENREYRPPMGYRGPLLIHSSNTFEQDAIHYWMFAQFPEMQQVWSKRKEDYHHGAIVGIADLVDVVADHPSSWFRGAYGWILENARAFPEPIPYKGQRGLFSVPAEVVKDVIGQVVV